MKKDYISAEFKAVRFNSEDIICTSTEQITVTAVPKSLANTAGLKVAQIEDQTIDVFK